MKPTQEMIDRFLRWKLPKDFAPDHYISFDRESAQRLYNSTNGNSWPTGTNLFTADEARQMLEYVMKDEQKAAGQEGLLPVMESSGDSTPAPAAPTTPMPKDGMDTEAELRYTAISIRQGSHPRAEQFDADLMARAATELAAAREELKRVTLLGCKQVERAERAEAQLAELKRLVKEMVDEADDIDDVMYFTLAPLRAFLERGE